MPPVSTHVNFARLFLAQSQSHYDAFYFVLGCIVPGCFDRESHSSFRAHHFMVDDSGSDLDYFARATEPVHQSHDANTLAFVAGYYSHLWLDNYFQVHDDALQIINPGNLSPNELRSLARENVQAYDLMDTAVFLRALQEVTLPRQVPGLEFASLACGVRLLQQLTDSSANVPYVDSQLVAITKDDYDGFLKDAVREFANTFISLNQAMPNH